MSLQRYIYNLGSLMLTDLSGGAVGTGATSVKVCDLNELSIEISGKTVKGSGQDNYPVIVQRGEEELKGKAKFLRFDPRIVACIYHGVTLVPGMIQMVPDEDAVALASVPCANHSTFLYDHQVYNALTGAEFKRMSNTVAQTALLAGQYTCSTTGTYAFSPVDVTAAVPVKLNYARQDSTTGWSYSVSSQPQGTTPIFQIHAQNVINTPSGVQTDDIVIYAATATGYKEGRKSGEFCHPELDIIAMKSPSGLIYKRSGNTGTY